MSEVEGPGGDRTLAEMYRQQLLVLQQAVVEEREEDARINSMCQSTLRVKYDSLVESLQHKAKIEGDMYMERALTSLEQHVKKESESLREKFESQQAIEEATTSRLQSIISDLRKSWEDEEISRAKRLEDRLRGHYTVILEQMEAQLQMALQLQDEVDKQWVKDVEMRNRQQVKLMNAFEKKCRRLYDTRLTEYIEKTDEQMTEYTTQLLQVGGAIAQERSRVESHKRRMKMACFQWKVDYQTDVDRKYQKMLAAMETKYHAEIHSLLEQKERYLSGKGASGFGGGPRMDSSSFDASSTDPVSMVEGLKAVFVDANVSSETQLQIAYALLETATSNPQMSASYDFIRQKMASRGLIAKKVERKNFLQYKMDVLKKTAKGVGPTGGGVSLTMQQKMENSEMTKELADLQVQLEELYKKYDTFYGEPYHVSQAVAATTTTQGQQSPTQSSQPLQIGSPQSAAGKMRIRPTK